ncbi:MULTISPECIES: carbamate kinase [Rahnella]|uniref:Carbamate kinase n=1 Tax=Rahnella laticis TaxID=2787622 RepID=A0ABS0E7L3_9GAMM|nr:MULTISPECIES: carbamate kinase [Rahnella]MBF7981085.1 carbamate kinase [Rahnella laticis]MBF8001153.1 carbamate kinase [Rahnella sp. LAC-M12]
MSRRKRIVLALGGNALGKNLPEQMEAVKTTSRAVVDLIAEGHEVIITHGNGPQVGMIHLAFEAASKVDPTMPLLPMSVCVALSQGYIGYDLQNALREELLSRGINKPVATLITQVTVDPDDPAFADPSKPIGSFFTESEAKVLQRQGIVMKEDAGRGYRRVVASPKPQDIVETDSICQLIDAGTVVIAGGGGGIPVVREGHHLKGISAVIDKDWASARLAVQIDADMLIILTAVEKVAIHFGTPQQTWLDTLNASDARQLINDNQFAKGSMLPKVEAALAFAESAPGRMSLITLLEKARDGIAGKTGTLISL